MCLLAETKKKGKREEGGGKEQQQQRQQTTHIYKGKRCKSSKISTKPAPLVRNSANKSQHANKSQLCECTNCNWAQGLRIAGKWQCVAKCAKKPESKRDSGPITADDAVVVLHVTNIEPFQIAIQRNATFVNSEVVEIALASSYKGTLSSR